MNIKSKRWLLIAIIIAIIGGFIGYSSQPDPVEIAVGIVEKGTVERSVTNTRAGTVSACRRAKLSASIGGQIAALPVRKGDTVKTGQLLVELWNEDLNAQLTLAHSQAQSATELAQASCLKAELSQREAERLAKLRLSGAISEEKVDAAATQAKIGQADCRASRAAANVSKAHIGVAQANLERSRLTAPFDGIVAEINGELNEYVTPSPPGIPTPPVIDLIDNQCFYVKALIDEVDAPDIREGMPAKISLDVFRGRYFDGEVQRIGSYVVELEKQARTIEVEIRFKHNEDIKKLLAGYSADTEIILESRPDTLRIPTPAVLDGGHVFVYRETDRKLERRPIEAGLTNWDFSEVLSGLQAGEKVVISTDREDLVNGAAAVLAQPESSTP